jgi:hypothetical protein
VTFHSEATAAMKKECEWCAISTNRPGTTKTMMNSIVYIVGAVVIALLSFFGLR